MNLKHKFRLIHQLTGLTAALLLFTSGCGGGGGSSSAKNKNLILPEVSGFTIVTDIVNLDLNDDGYEDLLLFRTPEDPYYSGLYIQALINQGGKTFVDETEFYFGEFNDDHVNAKWADKAYLVDLNDDDLLDIVIHVDLDLAFSEPAPPLIRQQNGSFVATNNATLLPLEGAMLPIDANDDDKPDILVRKVANFGNETTQQQQWTLFLNTSTDELSFSNEGVVTSGAHLGWEYSAFSYAPVVLDINNDGYDDFLYGGPKWKNNVFVDEQTPLTVYINDQENGFVESAASIFPEGIPTFTHVREMMVGDVTSSGFDSIVVANTGYDWEPYPGQKNAVLENDGSGTLTTNIGNSNTHNYKGFTHSADIGDIDNDGDLDIVYTDILVNGKTTSEQNRILINDGNGNFTRKSFSLNAQPFTSTKLVDLNNDDFPELVLGGQNAASNSLVVWNNGKGSFD